MDCECGAATMTVSVEYPDSTTKLTHLSCDACGVDFVERYVLRPSHAALICGRGNGADVIELGPRWTRAW